MKKRLDGSLMSSRRGLSDVITTVLIILLVLAAVVIIWTFVRPAIQSGAGKITGACVALDLSVVSCNTAGDSVINRGADNVDLTELVVVVTDSDGDSKSCGKDCHDTDVVEELGRKAYNASSKVVSPITADEMSVTGRVRTEAGELQLCPVTSLTVKCA